MHGHIISLTLCVKLSVRVLCSSRTKVYYEQFSKAQAKPQRPTGGGRFLTQPEDVFLYNNWDNVSWDEEQEKEARAKVEKNTRTKVSDELIKKYEDDADIHWDDFYSQHQNRFFKDRHWLFTEFPELAGKDMMSVTMPVKTGNTKSEVMEERNTASEVETPAKDLISDDCIHQIPDSMDYPGRSAQLRLFEVGCGVGNTVIPVIQTNNDPGLFIYGCDLSTTAVQLLKDHPDYDLKRCHAFVCDITDPAAKLPFTGESLDIIILIFILSAINPDKMQQTINRLSSYLKPGGRIVFRDYGRYDLAQLRFKDGKCLRDNFYARGDGTRVYFFTQEELREMFSGAGLEEEQNIVDRRLQVNRGRQLKMYRVWIQCKYRKPLIS